MKNKIDLNRLKPRNFWDCDFSQLDGERDRDFIVFRVLQRGSFEEINYLHKIFSVNEILKILNKWREKDELMLNYYNTIFKYEKSDFQRT